jgi:hypothetical protein
MNRIKAVVGADLAIAASGRARMSRLHSRLQLLFAVPEATAGRFDRDEIAQTMQPGCGVEAGADLGGATKVSLDGIGEGQIE